MSDSLVMDGSEAVAQCASCSETVPVALLSECVTCHSKFCGLVVNNCKAICACDLAVMLTAESMAVN